MRLLNRSALVIKRLEEGGYWDDKGRFVDRDSATEICIKCNIQPFRESNSQTILPEGVSSGDALVIRTKTPLKTSEQIGDKITADTAEIDGFTYEAFYDENWTRYGTSVDHHKVTFIRKDQDSGGNL